MMAVLCGGTGRSDKQSDTGTTSVASQRLLVERAEHKHHLSSKMLLATREKKK